MDFEYRENSNGGFELYNTKIGDIYFSNIGAYNEAMEKFVVPAKDFINSKTKIRILDACYGMGYNSKSFISYILSNNLNVDCEIDAVDIDKNILALSLFIFDENILNDVHIKFGQELLRSMNLDENIKKISGENWIKYFLDKNEGFFETQNKKSGVYLYKKDKISTCLHNIYYQNQKNFAKRLKIDFYLENLSKFLLNNKTKYDLIFHDAFSIKKQPELWGEDIMSSYYNLLCIGGMFLTYSNSRVLRRTLEQIGFKVIVNYNNFEKQCGTIAIKM